MSNFVLWKKPIHFSLLYRSSKVCTNHRRYIQHAVFHSKKETFNSLISKQNVHNFHTSQKISAPILPLILTILKPITKGLAILTGRGVRKWWRNLPNNKKSYFIQTAKQNRNKIAGFLLLTSGISVIYYYSHLQETPITNRRRFVAFTPKQIEKIAQFEFEMQMELNKSKLLPTNHQACKRVANVANQLLYANNDLENIRNKKWSISVINEDVQNAFVLPSGQIFVFTGMLNLCDNNDQLGVILAHEMSHCILGHAGETLSVAHLVDLVLIVVLAAIWAIMPSDGIAAVTHWFFNKVVEILFHLPYSRKLEVEADEVGLQLAAKACFDVREGSAFWAKIAVLNELNQNEPDIEWLSTHPNHERRSTHLDELMNETIELRKRLGCPALMGTDPRSGIQAFRKLIQDEIKQRENARHKQVVQIVTISNK